jgi:hypothetical protein
VARFVLGLVLGIGAAFVIAERSRIRSGDDDAAKPPAPVPAEGSGAPAGNGDRNATSGGGNSGGLPMHLTLSMGIGILALALTAPYVDGWFRRLNGLKSPLIELQLAGSSTHKVSVAEGLDVLFNVVALKHLQSYDSRINDDIKYLTKYGNNIRNQQNVIQSAKTLLPTFKRIIGPVATCVQSAIDQGWLSIESARKLITPTADLLEQIILGEDVLRDRGKLEEKHDEFWQQITKLPEIIHSRVGIPECIGIYSDFKTAQDLKTLFPRFHDYKNVPYLHVTAAYLISFAGDGDKAMLVLQKANDLQKADGQPVLDFKDFTFLYLIGRLSYYQGRVGDISGSYFGFFNELRAATRSRIDNLERAKEECGNAEPPDPLCFAQIYEVVAKNLAAYYVAEDLARGNAYAKNYTARVHEYAEEIKSLAGELDKGGFRKNAFYTYLQGDKYGMLDTYAYATLVLEASKPNPDYDLIKKDVVDVLRGVVEHREEEIVKKFKGLSQADRYLQVDRYQLAQLRISQAHLASARELVGE